MNGHAVGATSRQNDACEVGTRRGTVDGPACQHTPKKGRGPKTRNRAVGEDGDKWAIGGRWVPNPMVPQLLILQPLTGVPAHRLPRRARSQLRHAPHFLAGTLGKA